MAEIASLSVGIDGNLSGFERVIGRATNLLNRLEAQGAESGRNFDRNFGNALAQTAGRAINSLDQINSRIALLTQRRSLSLDTSVIARTNRELADLQARASQLQNLGVSNSAFPTPSAGSTAGLLSYAGGILSIGSALNALKSGFEVVKDFDRLDRKLQGATTSQTAYNRGVNITRSLSDRYGLSVESLTSSYADLTASSEGTTLAGKETDKVFAAVTARAARLGLTANQTERALLAIGQMMNKGSIQAEELKGQLAESGLAGAYGTMAKAVGVSTQELGRMLERGELASSDILPKFAAELLKTANGAEANANSIGGSFQRATDQVSLFIAEFSKTAGVDSFFAKFGNGIANTLQGLRELNSGTKQGSGLGDFFKKVTPRVLPAVGIAKVLASIKAPVLEEATYRAKAKQEFSGKDYAGRAAQFAQLQTDIVRSEASINSRSKDTILDSPELRRDRQTLASKKKLLIELRSENLRLAKADQESAKSAAKSGVKLNPLVTFEAYKKERDALEQERKDLAVNGKLLTDIKAKRLAALDARLERAEPPKKNKATNVNQPAAKSTYDLLTQDLSKLQNEAKTFVLLNPGKAIPKELADRIEFVKRKLKEVDDLISNKEPKTLYAQLTEQLGKLGDQARDLDLAGKVVPPKLREDIQGLVAKLAEADRVLTKLKKAKVPGAVDVGGFKVDQKLDNVQGQLDRFTEASAAVEDAKKQYRELPGFIGKLATNAEAATGDLFGAVGDAARKQLAEAGNIFKEFKETTRGNVAGVFASIGESFVTGTADPFKSALDTILDGIANFIIQLGTSMLLSSKLLAFAAPFLGGTTLPLSVGQGIAGAAMLVGGGAIKALASRGKGYATGGYISGEGSGTSDSIPIRVSNGEYILRAAAVRKIGVSALNSLNRVGELPQGFARGGAVGYSPARFDSPAANIPVERFNTFDRGNNRTERIQVVVTGKLRGNDQELQAARTARQGKILGRG
ncbi:tape measure protein [Fibrella forsythiae]|uniref:Tape measure protein n=1 Tax=Fibrella forsythiae TaxID=2817061 RepID=A0ABS3JE24_9BACT|nr:tape measure protein [Fibrella forsythiae]MBO0947519.1 tape measure protein [Fibrella forsythiae]